MTSEEMLELASGASVLQLRSVEFARNHDVRLAGAVYVFRRRANVDRREEDPVLEQAIISGVTHQDAFDLGAA
jgi:aspartokinase